MTMRKMTLVVLTVGALAVSGMRAPAIAQSTLFDGQVTKIDQAAGKLTIKHGPIQKFEMDDPMTMVYRVQDPAMLKAVKVGDKVKFDLDRVNNQFTVTKIEKAK
jgi:Cu(I)/Ag(I) efflux system periplasmic protein CusF